MRRLAAALLVVAVAAGASNPAYADQAEVREIARNNGCPPKKIDIFKQSLGSEGQTIYRVQCTMPKVVDTTAKGPDELLVSCRDSLCELVRPYSEDQQKK